MDNAGRNAATLIDSLWPGRPVLIACGKGNNAGDGFVIARHLELLGHDVRLLMSTSPRELAGDAAVNYRIAERSGIPIADPLGGWITRLAVGPHLGNHAHGSRRAIGRPHPRRCPSRHGRPRAAPRADRHGDRRDQRRPHRLAADEGGRDRPPFGARLRHGRSGRRVRAGRCDRDLRRTQAGLRHAASQRVHWHCPRRRHRCGPRSSSPISTSHYPEHDVVDSRFQMTDIRPVHTEARGASREGRQGRAKSRVVWQKSFGSDRL